jgi:hypothetical protein
MKREQETNPKMEPSGKGSVLDELEPIVVPGIPRPNDLSDAGREVHKAVAAAIERKLASSHRLSETILTINLADLVEYFGDIGNPSQYATQPGQTPPTHPKNFTVVTLIGDIHQVIGDGFTYQAKGTYVGRSRGVGLGGPNPTGVLPTEAEADVTRVALREHIFEILQPNGTAIGTIMSLGFSGGPPPPGAPSTEHGNWAIVGGTGAFVGARGTVGGVGGTLGQTRQASMREDPKNRWENNVYLYHPGDPIHTGTAYKFSFFLHVIPMEAPWVVELPSGPAIYHADFTLVSSANPAQPNETLLLFATGLGPTVPEVALGTAFPPIDVQNLHTTAPCNVNSPVWITVNGKAAYVLEAIGYPNAVDVYKIEFQVPTSVGQGDAMVHVTAAFIKSQVVNMAVRLPSHPSASRGTMFHGPEKLTGASGTPG